MITLCGIYTIYLYTDYVRHGKCVTFGFGQETLAVAPLQLKDVEADEILQVHQNHHQGVQLVGQPEVCKLHPVERRREDAELESNATECQQQV